MKRIYCNKKNYKKKVQMDYRNVKFQSDTGFDLMISKLTRIKIGWPMLPAEQPVKC